MKQENDRIVRRDKNHAPPDVVRADNITGNVRVRDSADAMAAESRAWYDLSFAGCSMDERTAEQLAVLVGGEAWQSGGGIWLVTVNREDGSLVVFSADAVCEYENDETFDAGRASKTIFLTIPETEDLYVIVDLEGNVFYQDNAMERGWRYEEDARHEARALESRGEGRFSVVKQSELPA